MGTIKNKWYSVLAACTLTGLLAACNTVPPTNVHQPMSVRPVPPPLTQASPGAIYQASVNTPLFETKRARNVGDTLTIQINENTNAARKGATKTDRTQSNSFSVPVLTGLPGKSFLNAALQTDSANSLDGSGESSANGSFTGAITVTVIEVLANGNLLVSGEKQVGLNYETQYLRLSGVVNPTQIGFGNIVSSAQVADARIEYRGSGSVDSAQIMGWLAKFFLTFLPF
jgi:flagellar L-ring protein precursor FlgH